MEIWKLCEDFPMYEVSNKGQVRNKNTKKILKPAGGENYQQYCLKKDGKAYNEYGHRLVAKAFVPNPNNYNIVHHKDSKRWNNDAENLEWVDHSEHVSSHKKGNHWKWSADAKGRVWSEENKAKRSKQYKAYAQTEAGKAHIDKWLSAMRAGHAKKYGISQ